MSPFLTNSDLKPAFNSIDALKEDPFSLELQEICSKIFETFHFKPNIGRIWAMLFYCTRPLSQRELMYLLGFSSGFISQGLGNLARFGMIKSQETPNSREIHYYVEDNLTKILFNILSKREQLFLDQLMEQVENLKFRLAVTQTNSPHAKIRLEGLEQILAIGQLANSLILFIESLSNYSYHTVLLGAKVLSKLNIKTLSNWHTNEQSSPNTSTPKRLKRWYHRRYRSKNKKSS